MDVHVLLNGIRVKDDGLGNHGLLHGLNKLSMDFNHGHCPWLSMYIHVLLNGTMVRDHGLTDHDQSPWYVKT